MLEHLLPNGPFYCMTFRMSADWRDFYRSWSNPDILAHPNSPAGGAGPGGSATLKQYDPGAKGPPPASPAARTYDYQSALRLRPGAKRRQFSYKLTKENIAPFRQ